MWPNPQETADLVTFTEEIINGKLRFFGAVCAESVYNDPAHYLGTFFVQFFQISLCHYTLIMLHYFYVVLFSCFAISNVLFFSCCTLFMLHFFCVAPFHVALFLCCTFFRAALSSCCILYMLHFFLIALFPFFAMLVTFYFFFVLYFFHVSLFSCCTLSVLHFFHVTYFQWCTFLCFAISMLQLCLYCTLFMLHFFHVAIFPCCTVFMFIFFVLHYFNAVFLCSTLFMLHCHK